MLQEEDTFYKELGERVKNQRLKEKKSQEELADYLNLTRSSMVNFEKGRHRPSIHQLIKMANFLKINYVKLIPFDFDKEQQPSGEIKIENAVSDEKLDLSTINALKNFISDINKK